MTKGKTSKVLATALAGVASAGCMSFDDPPVIKTWVQDWRSEIIYQVLVDRFANGDVSNDYALNLNSMAQWHGGDWKGLEDRLDYIKELGATTIWISPVVKNVDSDSGFAGYHGYWTQDHDSPNMHFGDIPALQHMIKTAHEKDLHVILDIVTNHMGQLFYYDINMNGEANDQVFGGGCDKWGNPSDTGNIWPNYSQEGLSVKCLPGVNCDPSTCKPEVTPNDCVYFDASSCVIKDGQSGLKHIGEYDPEFNPNGVIQAYTSLGYSGPAPIIFRSVPYDNHMPPMPYIFQSDATAFNRRGRTVNYSDGDQLMHGDFPGGLKDINTLNCNVKRALVDSYARWVEIADFDGFRIDTLKHVEPEFWRYFTQRVRQRLAEKGKTNFFMFGEAFDGDDTLVGSFTKGGGFDKADRPAWPQSEVLGDPDLKAENDGCFDEGAPAIMADQLDSAFYFPQYYQVFGDVFRDGGATSKIEDLWSQRQNNWGTTLVTGGIGVEPYKVPVNFLDNHDVGRFLFYQFFHADQGLLATNPAAFDQIRDEKLKIALVFIFAEQGIPCIYYGDEQGFEGGNDPANREDMWNSGYAEDTTTDQTTGKVYGRFFKWIRKLADLRKQNKALTHGDQNVIYSTVHTGGEEDTGLFAFERTGGDADGSYVLAVFNTSNGGPRKPDPTRWKKLSVASGTTLTDALSGTTYTVAADGTIGGLELDRLSAKVLVAGN